MIKIDFTGRKRIKFHVQVWGTNLSALRGVLVVSDVHAGDNGVEYRFEGKLENDTIEVLLPPLNKIIKRDVENDTVLNSYLEVMGDGLYDIPWKDELLIKNKRSNVENLEQGDINIEKEESKPSKQSILEDEIEGKEKDSSESGKTERVEKSKINEEKIQDIISTINNIKEIDVGDLLKTSKRYHVSEEDDEKPEENKEENRDERVKDNVEKDGKIEEEEHIEIEKDTEVVENKQENKEDKQENKEDKSIKENVEEKKIKEVKEEKKPKDKKRHQKKVMATLLNISSK